MYRRVRPSSSLLLIEGKEKTTKPNQNKRIRSFLVAWKYKDMKNRVREVNQREAQSIHPTNSTNKKLSQFNCSYKATRPMQLLQLTLTAAQSQFRLDGPYTSSGSGKASQPCHSWTPSCIAMSTPAKPPMLNHQ